MTERKHTNTDRAFTWKKSEQSTVENCSLDKISQSVTFPSRATHAHESYDSRVSGQHLAGSGALVFEGELLEFPLWGAQAA